MDESALNRNKQYLALKEIHKKQISDRIYKRNQNHSIELISDKIMIEKLKSQEDKEIEKEKQEEENRRETRKKILEEQRVADYKAEKNPKEMREFELNKKNIL